MSPQAITAWAQRLTILIVVVGVLVHLYIGVTFTQWNILRKRADAIFFFLFPVSPYIALALLAPFKRPAVIAAACAVAALGASLFVLWHYFPAARRRDGFAYVLAYMPMWTWLLVMPTGLALGLLINWRCKRNASKS